MLLILNMEATKFQILVPGFSFRFSHPPAHGWRSLVHTTWWGAKGEKNRKQHTFVEARWNTRGMVE